jgi:hypothetical protein
VFCYVAAKDVPVVCHWLKNELPIVHHWLIRTP